MAWKKAMCERDLLFSVFDDGGGAIADDDDYCFRVFKQFSDDVCHLNLANTEQTQRESWWWDILCSNCMCNLKRIFTSNWKWTMDKRNGHFLMCTYFWVIDAYVCGGGWFNTWCADCYFNAYANINEKRDRSVCQSASWNMGNYLNIWPLLHHGIIKINKVLSSACIFSQTHINQLPWTWTLFQFSKVLTLDSFSCLNSSWLFLLFLFSLTLKRSS